MTEPMKPDDRDLERYLKGDSAVSRRYREASRETAPPGLDEAILARARAEARRKPSLNRLLAPFALAASVLLGVNLAWNVWQAQPVLEAPSAPAAAPPAAPAPVRSDQDGLLAQAETRRQEQRKKEAVADREVKREALQERSAALASEGRAAVGMASAPAPEADVIRDRNERVARAASEARGTLPPGWHLVGHAPHLYEAGIDETTVRSAPDSLVMWRTGEGVERCGRLQSQVPSEKYLGKDVRLKLFMRTQDVKGPNVILFLTHGRGGYIQHDMGSQGRVGPAEGTWRQQEVTAAIPDNADRIVYGALLCGPGTLWIDDIELESR